VIVATAASNRLMAWNSSKLAALTRRLPEASIEVDNGPRGVCVKIFYRRRPAWIAAGVLTVIALVFVRNVYYDNNLDYQLSAMTIVLILGLLFLAVVSILPHPVEPTTLLASINGLELRSNVHRLVVHTWPRDRIEQIFVRPWTERGRHKESLALGVQLTDGTQVVFGYGTPEEADAVSDALRRGLGLEAAPEETAAAEEDAVPSPGTPDEGAEVKKSSGLD
jgi:hypothetical protein